MITIVAHFAIDRAAWRAWLEHNHATEREIWLLFYKKHTGKPCVSYNAAVEEALCFGWIDGKLRRIDEEKHIQRFTPRKPTSVWSESNKARVRTLTSLGRMTKAGLALVWEAKRRGTWDQEQVGPVDDPPPDLAQALARNRRAKENFERFAPGYRRGYIRWVLMARKPETRQRRIMKVVERSAANKKPGML